jgi:hypothetical protein
MYIPQSKFYKPSTAVLPSLMEDGEVALAMVQIGLNSKVLTNRRLLFMDMSDSKVKEFISLDKIDSFSFGSFAGTPRIDALMKDGTKLKLGSLDQKWLPDVQRVFESVLAGNIEIALASASDDDAGGLTAAENMKTKGAPPAMARTNSQKAFPKWLQKSIHDHKRSDEELLMLITEPYTNHQGALLVFGDRCMIVKGGLIGGFMSGSLGGERASTFYFNQITGIEFNSGWINGVLEILTPSYQGGANKDFWRGTTKSRNADSNDPWTLSNCLPLTKDAYNSARDMIDELKQMIAAYSRPSQSSQSGSLDLASEIAKLSDLHRQGVLSDAEFAQAKSKLLG